MFVAWALCELSATISSLSLSLSLRFLLTDLSAAERCARLVHRGTILSKVHHSPVGLGRSARIYSISADGKDLTWRSPNKIATRGSRESSMLKFTLKSF